MYRIAKTWQIDASHQLTSLPAEHKCSRLHGHTYTISVEVEAPEWNEHGFVLDYGDLDTVIRAYDHRHLNDFLHPPTAEAFAHALWNHLLTTVRVRGAPDARLVRVRVSETPQTWAEVTP